jgi:hypothetical protein
LQSFLTLNYRLKAYLDSKIVNCTYEEGEEHGDADGNKVVAVHEFVKPVNGVLQDLFNQDTEPQTVELGEESGNDGKAPRDLTELGLKASVFFRNIPLYLVEGETQVLEEDLLDQHIDFPDCL